jgi:AcrR family transcriptional regulator
MCPYPAQVNRETILQQAQAMIEAEGVEHLSLHKLAAALGVKAPSLYRYFTHKADLLQAVNLATNQALVAALGHTQTLAGTDPAQRFLAMAQAYRAFAQANPATYGLAYSNLLPEARPDPQTLEALALPIQALMAEIVGAERSLAALRGAWALLHGFVTLELNGQFQRGGDLDAAFAQAVRAYLMGWQAIPGTGSGG